MRDKTDLHDEPEVGIKLLHLLPEYLVSHVKNHSLFRNTSGYFHPYSPFKFSIFYHILSCALIID